ncbi:Transcriptional regulator, TetR family [Streptomyces lividans 1326]|uniref:Transcriptional regulator, TetR family n=1 Tax=Streptomyces lividans 1326 TaxID=1200984 RepID=A0A7U9HF61_STRLI|nr:Transcriptional regulator, TetR family [Streptomyces lividans 1326]
MSNIRHTNVGQPGLRQPGIRQPGIRESAIRQPDVRHTPVAPTRAQRLDAGQRIDAHRHDEHQIVHAGSGVVAVTTESGTWFAPGTRAIWIPAGTARPPRPRPTRPAPGRPARRRQPARPGQPRRPRRRPAAARTDRRLHPRPPRHGPGTRPPPGRAVRPVARLAAAALTPAHPQGPPAGRGLRAGPRRPRGHPHPRRPRCRHRHRGTHPQPALPPRVRHDLPPVAHPVPPLPRPAHARRRPARDHRRPPLRLVLRQRVHRRLPACVRLYARNPQPPGGNRPPPGSYRRVISRGRPP